MSLTGRKKRRCGANPVSDKGGEGGAVLPPHTKLQTTDNLQTERPFPPPLRGGGTTKGVGLKGLSPPILIYRRRSVDLDKNIVVVVLWGKGVNDDIVSSLYVTLYRQRGKGVPT